MKRFIFVSFGFLAWAFYELSGGADFQPRVAATPPVATPEIAQKASSTVSDKPVSVEAATLVASPAIAPVNAALVTQDPAPVPVAAVDTIPATTVTATESDLQTVDNLNQIRAGLGQGLSLFPGSDPVAQPMMLASLEQGVAGMVTAPPADPEPSEPVVEAPPPADIREIRGTRVNMRDGPGTIYPVITRLTLGQEVEVLGDSGTGWLRLRTLPDQTTGWIAASLVSKAKR